MTELNLKIDEKLFYKQVYLEYSKTKEDIAEYVEILTKWAATQKHFPEMPPKKVIQFCLLITKFSTEKSKSHLDMYYTIRGLMPDIFLNHPLSPKMILHSKIIYVIPLPKPTANMQRIIYCSINPDYVDCPEKFDHAAFNCHFINVIELIIEEDKCFNFHIIYDLLFAKMGHIARFDLMQVKKMSMVVEKVYANRVASVYVVNFHSFLESVANKLFLPFLKPKIRERVKFYNTSQILLEDFDKSIMPKDIGGEEKSLAELNELLLKKFEHLKPRFDQLQQLKVNETLRPDKLENHDILGYYGSFKQINVD